MENEGEVQRNLRTRYKQQKINGQF